MKAQRAKTRGLALRQPTPLGACLEISSRAIKLHADRAHEALNPERKDHTFCATPARHLSRRFECAKIVDKNRLRSLFPTLDQVLG